MKLIKTAAEETAEIVFRDLPITFSLVSLMVAVVLKIFEIGKTLANNILLDIVLRSVIIAHILLVVVFFYCLYITLFRKTADYRRKRLTVKEIIRRQYNYDDEERE